MHYTKSLTACALLLAFGAVQACPGPDAKSSTQSSSGTVAKPLAPKPAA